MGIDEKAHTRGARGAQVKKRTGALWRESTIRSCAALLLVGVPMEASLSVLNCGTDKVSVAM
ncbi:MAG: hypothetical protein ACYDCX_09060 [Acidithiobacillus sp.]